MVSKGASTAKGHVGLFVLGDEGRERELVWRGRGWRAPYKSLLDIYDRVGIIVMDGNRLLASLVST